MRVQLFVTIFVICCRADDFLQNYMNRYLNHSINPCDDFYGHICSAAPEDEHFITKMRHAMKERLSRHYSDHCKEMNKELELAEKIEPVTYTLEEKKAKIQEICSTDFPRCKRIAQFYIEKKNLSKEEIIEVVLNTTVSFEDPKMAEMGLFVFYAMGTCSGESLFSEIDSDPRILPSIKNVESRIEKMIKKLKKILIKNFNDTNWMQRSQKVEMYQKLVEDIVWQSPFNESYRPIAKNMYSKAKECLEVTLRWHPMSISSCIGKAFEITTKELAINLGIGFRNSIMPFEVNAGYNSYYNVIGTSPIVTLAALTEGITEVGTIGFILGHELTHAIFNTDTIRSLSIENLDCIKKHRQEVCKHSNFVCKMGDVTITEDAPDIMALATALELLENEKEGLDGNHPQFSKEEYFFYTLPMTFCTHQLDHQEDRPGVYNAHSPWKGRLNALLMHSEKFQKTFSCKPGDGMWREPDQFCHLLGPVANRR